MERTQGRLPRALVAIMMGLGAGAASTAACGSGPNEEGAGGDGAGGEDGYGPTANYVAAMSTYGVGPSTTPTSTSTSSGGSSRCDTEADCDACQACAFESVCLTQAVDCKTQPECVALNDCANACAPNDQACVDACADAHPNGLKPLLDLIECINCEACYETCDGATAEC